MPAIQSIETRDFRRQLEDGAGSDAVHTNPQYRYGVTLLEIKCSKPACQLIRAGLRIESKT